MRRLSAVALALASAGNVLILVGTLLGHVIYPLLWALLAANAAHFAFIAYAVRKTVLVDIPAIGVYYEQVRKITHPR